MESLFTLYYYFCSFLTLHIFLIPFNDTSKVTDRKNMYIVLTYLCKKKLSIAIVILIKVFIVNSQKSTHVKKKFVDSREKKNAVFISFSSFVCLHARHGGQKAFE